MTNKNKLDDVVQTALKNRDIRNKGYRELSLKIHPWVCAKCGREFNRKNLHELTVHHKDHNHENNPPDGSNWENLCLYCHDDEHSRYLIDNRNLEDKSTEKIVTHNPFSGLAKLLEKKQNK